MLMVVWFMLIILWPVLMVVGPVIMIIIFYFFVQYEEILNRSYQLQRNTVRPDILNALQSTLSLELYPPLPHESEQGLQVEVTESYTIATVLISGLSLREMFSHNLPYCQGD